jgi:hypothetical protein
VPVAREYRFVASAATPWARTAGQHHVRLASNTKTASPAAGRVVILSPRRGRPLFLGETRSRTAEGARVELTLGQAFDVTARARQTAFERPSDRLTEVAFEIVLENAKPTPVTATVVEEMAGEWRVLEESHPHERTAAQRAEWRVPVPAGGRAVLTYRVRIES